MARHGLVRTLDDLRRRRASGSSSGSTSTSRCDGRRDHRRHADPRRAADAARSCASRARGSCSPPSRPARRAATRSCRWRPSPTRLAELLGARRSRSRAESLDERARRRRRDARERPLRAGRDEERPGARAGATRALADVYVNDAFGAAHRAHASTEARRAPAADARPGGCSSARSRRCTAILDDPERPLVAIVGGAKVTDKIGVIDALPGASPTRSSSAARCASRSSRPRATRSATRCARRRASSPRARALADGRRASCACPVDLVLGASSRADAERRALDGVDVPDGWMGLDIGPQRPRSTRGEIAAAGTVFWNGPMGAFELEPFAAGTRAVAEAVAAARGTHRRRRRRLRRGARAVRARRPGRPPVHRRRRVAGAGRGQDRCPASRSLR